MTNSYFVLFLQALFHPKLVEKIRACCQRKWKDNKKAPQALKAQRKLHQITDTEIDIYQSLVLLLLRYFFYSFKQYLCTQNGIYFLIVRNISVELVFKVSGQFTNQSKVNLQ